MFQAKKKINEIFLEVEGYVGEAERFLASVPRCWQWMLLLLANKVQFVKLHLKLSQTTERFRKQAFCSGTQEWHQRKFILLLRSLVSIFFCTDGKYS